MSDQLPELTQEEKAALYSIDMTEILGTPAERLQFALDKAVQFMRERNVAKASEKMAWAEQGKLQAMLDERTLQHQAQLDNTERLNVPDVWQTEYVNVAKQFLELEKKFETEADLRVHWQTKCCKVIDELRNQRDMIESCVREIEKTRGLLRETFLDPGPTCELAGNLSTPFAYFDQPRWERLKERCRALLGEDEPSKDI